MYETNQLAGKGLKLLFLAELLLMVSVVLAGLLESGLELAALILSLVGLHRAAPSHPLFRRALHLTVAQLAISGLTTLIYGVGPRILPLRAITGLGMLFTVAVFILQFYIVYLAGELLTAGGFDAEAARGRAAWKFYLANVVLSLLFTVAATFILSLMTAIGTASVMAFSFVSSLVMGIVRLTCLIIYLIFLYHAYHALLNGD